MTAHTASLLAAFTGTAVIAAGATAQNVPEQIEIRPDIVETTRSCRYAWEQTNIRLTNSSDELTFAPVSRFDLECHPASKPWLGYEFGADLGQQTMLNTESQHYRIDKAAITFTTQEGNHNFNVRAGLMRNFSVLDMNQIWNNPYVPPGIAASLDDGIDRFAGLEWSATVPWKKWQFAFVGAAGVTLKDDPLRVSDAINYLREINFAPAFRTELEARANSFFTRLSREANDFLDDAASGLPTLPDRYLPSQSDAALEDAAESLRGYALQAEEHVPQLAQDLRDMAGRLENASPVEIFLLRNVLRSPEFLSSYNQAVKDARTNAAAVIAKTKADAIAYIRAMPDDYINGKVMEMASAAVAGLENEKISNTAIITTALAANELAGGTIDWNYLSRLLQVTDGRRGDSSATSYRAGIEMRRLGTRGSFGLSYTLGRIMPAAVENNGAFADNDMMTADAIEISRSLTIDWQRQITRSLRGFIGFRAVGSQNWRNLRPVGDEDFDYSYGAAYGGAIYSPKAFPKFDLGCSRGRFTSLPFSNAVESSCGFTYATTLRSGPDLRLHAAAGRIKPLETSENEGIRLSFHEQENRSFRVGFNVSYD